MSGPGMLPWVGKRLEIEVWAQNLKVPQLTEKLRDQGTDTKRKRLVLNTHSTQDDAENRQDDNGAEKQDEQANNGNNYEIGNASSVRSITRGQRWIQLGAIWYQVVKDQAVGVDVILVVALTASMAWRLKKVLVFVAHRIERVRIAMTQALYRVVWDREIAANVLLLRTVNDKAEKEDAGDAQNDGYEDGALFDLPFEVFDDERAEEYTAYQTDEADGACYHCGRAGKETVLVFEILGEIAGESFDQQCFTCGAADNEEEDFVGQDSFGAEKKVVQIEKESSFARTRTCLTDHRYHGAWVITVGCLGR